MTTSERQAWLAELRGPLERLLRDAENYAAFSRAKPPTERAYSDALNAIRAARWTIREARRQSRECVS